MTREQPIHQSLHGCAWTLTGGAHMPGPVPAAVPGCVHTDLLAANLIPDPHADFAEPDLEWIGRTDWTYRCLFNLDAESLARDRLELVCDGLDTIATISVNGRVVGSAQNMHVAHRFDITAAARLGVNELVIELASPVEYARRMEAKLGPLPHAYDDHEPFNFIRKMACNFGWDWGPRLTTSGIWRPIALCAWSTARLGTVRPLVVEASESRGKLSIHAPIVRTNPAPLELCATLRDPVGKVVAESRSAAETLELTIPNPARWWPRGFGDQPLYEVTVELCAQSAIIDTWTGRVGFRTVELDTSADDIGSRFTLMVNSKPVFCRGANWIPDDCFTSSMTPARYRRRIGQAHDANMNILRVWGGGIYESDAFYDICDELGILVWQDFAFACATYPEEAPFPELVEAEARDNVARLSRHPSLALWCGSNETIWGHHSWGWPERVPAGRPWGLGYYTDLLPRVLAELDPTRPYWPSSPYSADANLHPLDPDHGNRHTWEVCLDDYRSITPRFCAEFGHQSPACYATLARVTQPGGLEINSPSMAFRQRAGGGSEVRLDEPLQRLFRPPTSFDDWHYLTQVTQARSLTIGVEWMRANTPRCMGAIFWQLNDCWPVLGWSAIDSAGREKPLYHAAKRFFADRLLTIHSIDGQLTLFAVNDTDKHWSATADCRLYTIEGQAIHRDAPIDCPPRASTHVCALTELLGEPADSTRQFIVVDAAGCARATWFFVPDREFHYPKPEWSAALAGTPPNQTIEIEARSLLRDLVINIDRVDEDAQIADNLVTLLAGERWTVALRSANPIKADALDHPAVIRCVNPFGARSSQ